MQDKKRKQKIRIIINDLLILFSVIAIVTTLVFITQGWTLDKGSAQQTGLVQFSSSPTGATIEIGQNTLYAKTNTKANVLPGEHEFKIWREGYETWYRKTNVNAGEVLWLNYVRLVPKQKTIKTFGSFLNLKQMKIYPNRENALLLSSSDDGSVKFSKIDIKSESPVEKSVELSSDLFEKTTISKNGVETPIVLADQINIEAILNDNNHMIIKQTINNTVNWILIDISKPEESQNLTKEFNINFDQVKSISSDGSKLLVRTGNDLRQLNTNDKTVSAIIASSITDFNIYNNEVVGFTKKQDDSEKYSVGILKIGEKPIVVKTDLTSPKIAVSEYYNENYLHVIDDSHVYIYKASSWPTDKNNLKLYKTLSLSFSLDELQIDDDGRILTVSLKNKTYVYDIETDETFNIDTETDADTTRKITWIDPFVIYYFNQDKLIIRDFDGSNKQTLMTAQENFPVTLSSNNKYIYAIQKTEGDEYTLAQLKMIID